jgi:hypothetical protein
MGDRGSIPSRDLFLIVTASRPVLGSTQPPIQWVPRALTPVVKRLGRKANYLPPSSTELKNASSWRDT